MVYRASFLYVNQVSTVFISFHRFHVILFPKLSYLNDLAPFGSIWYFGIWTEFAAWHPHFQLAWQTWNLRDAALQKLAMDLQNGEHRWHGCNFGMEAEHWWISTDVTLWHDTGHPEAPTIIWLSFDSLKLDASKAERSKPAACWLHCCPEAHGARQECAGSLWLTFLPHTFETWNGLNWWTTQTPETGKIPWALHRIGRFFSLPWHSCKRCASCCGRFVALRCHCSEGLCVPESKGGSFG